jgi:hypothetical protein
MRPCSYCAFSQLTSEKKKIQGQVNPSWVLSALNNFYKSPGIAPVTWIKIMIKTFLRFEKCKFCFEKCKIPIDAIVPVIVNPSLIQGTAHGSKDEESTASK